MLRFLLIGAIAVVAFVFSGGDPLSPFVVGEEGHREEEEDDDAEDEFHG